MCLSVHIHITIIDACKGPPHSTTPAMAFRLNVPPVTRALLLLLVLLSTLNALLRWTALGKYRMAPLPQLTMVPRASSLRFPWTFFTASFVEQNIVSFLISGATLFYGGRYLERAWNSAEFARFVLFMVTVPNLITYFVYYIWFALRGTSMCVGPSTLCANKFRQTSLTRLQYEFHRWSCSGGSCAPGSI